MCLQTLQRSPIDDTANNHWTECPINIKSLKNLTSVNWIFAYRILIKNTKQKPDRPSHKPPSMCQLFGVLDWVQSIELEAPKRNRARPWHLIGQLKIWNMEKCDRQLCRCYFWHPELWRKNDLCPICMWEVQNLCTCLLHLELVMRS